MCYNRCAVENQFLEVNMKKAISSILVIIGIILILTPLISKVLIESREKLSAEIARQLTAEQMGKNNQREAVYDYDSIQEVEIRSLLSVRIDEIEINKNIIGVIIIEDLNISLPIVKGVSSSNLLIGAGTMKPDLVMGQGNYSLAAHYARGDKFFGRLLEIEEGTIVKITDKKTVYEYSIYDTQIVPDTSLYMLDQEQADKRGKPIISLMTCYYTSRNGKRFFALGELADQYPYE